MNRTTPGPAPAYLAHLTARELAAVRDYHCTFATCRAVPGVMCRRNRGLYIQVGRTLRRPHPVRMWAESRGLQEERYLVSQVEMILRELGQPMSQRRLFTVLEILRNVRARPGW